MVNLWRYDKVLPTFAGRPRAALQNHAVIGHATIGSRAWLGRGCVVRADGHFVKIGDDFHLGNGSTVHVAHGRYPAVLGDRVWVGDDAVVHACTVEDDVVVESGCVILDGATVGAKSVLKKGSVVYPRTKLAPGKLYAGSPARPIRNVGLDDFRARQEGILEGSPSGSILIQGQGVLDQHAVAATFVAATCNVLGAVYMTTGSSVWFGSRVDASDGAITIGADVNIQDNSFVVGETSIGAGTTVGHNVKLMHCMVGAHCLIGIGSQITSRTVIEDENFIAAGTKTEPGQLLEGGWLWGGSPARRLVPLGDARRIVIRDTAAIYRRYAQIFREMRVTQVTDLNWGNPR